MLKPLPIDPLIPQVVESLKNHSSAVLTAEPGAGKTTRIPPALVRAFPGRWLLLQPRRLAAKSCCLRILDEQNWKLEKDAGYIVRFENRTTAQTRLVVLTEGILSRILLDDPELKDITGVILDEFHERSLHSDLAITLLKEIQSSFKPELKILVMSATLDAGAVSRYLNDAPILQAPGNLHPVTVEYLPPQDPRSGLYSLPEQVVRAVQKTRQQSTGASLVFLPGRGEISRCENALREAGIDLPTFPLHGSLSLDEQTRALTPTGKPRLILSTNIAETSLTIEDVRTVVDSGWARVARTDPQFGMDRLDLSRISRASATQRQGRAGRLGPGRCVRLYSEGEFHQFKPFELPEILRMDLAATLLLLAQWGMTDPEKFDWFQMPPSSQLKTAQRLLQNWNFLDTRGAITSPGRDASTLPLHPRFAALFLAAQKQGIVRWGADAAALLGEISSSDLKWKTSSSAPHAHENDLESALYSVGGRTAQAIDKTSQQLLKFAESGKIQDGTPSSEVAHTQRLRALWAAYSDRLTRRRTKGSPQGVIVGGRGVSLDLEQSEVQNSAFWLSLASREVREQSRLQAKVSLAVGLSLEEIRFLAGPELREGLSIEWDGERQSVRVQSGVVFRGLLLEEKPLGRTPSAEQAAQIARCLFESLSQEAETIIRKADALAANWIDRCRFLSKVWPESGAPEWTESDLQRVFENGCQDRKSRQELESATDWLPLLQGSSPYDVVQLIEKEAPEKIDVPSGSRIRLDYASGDRIILAVRLQEIFGWKETPRIAGGRITLLMHLLSPNYRPVQVTEDLHSFWEKTYLEVKKELKARYPKHSWPDDPWTARPVAKGGIKR